MAKNLKVNLQFNADTSQAKTQLQQLQLQLNNLTTSTAANLKITPEIQKAQQAAIQLKTALSSAVNVDTGKFDLVKFSTSLNKMGTNLNILKSQLMSIGPAGQQAFMSLTQSILQAEIPTRRLSKHLVELKNTIGNTLRWQISSSLLHGMVSEISSAFRYAEDLNNSLNEIRIVTGQNIDQMAKFAQEANKAAKILSTTTTDYTNASLIYYQQGLSDEEVKKRTDITIKMANVAGESAETVSDQLTAVWNNFADGTKSLEYYADVMTALGAATASSVDEISGGLEKFAAIGETIGLSYEYAASALATITSNTRQSEEVVGTALKTIFARIQGLKLGETQDDGTTLNKYSEALASVGISIFETNGELKNMDNILNEMAAKWDTLNSAQQTALAQTVAGVRQYTQLISLMENWDSGDNDSMIANLDTSYNATGALQEQADIYAESWKAASERVQASAEEIYQTLLNDEFFIDLFDNFAKFLSLIDDLLDSMGGAKGLLSGLASILLYAFGGSIAKGLENMVYNFKTFVGLTKKATMELQKEAMSLSNFTDIKLVSNMQGQGVVSGLQSQITLSHALAEKQEQMNEMEQLQAQYIIEQNKAYADQVALLGQAADQAKNKLNDARYVMRNEASGLYSYNHIDATEKEMTTTVSSGYDITQRVLKARENFANGKSSYDDYIHQMEELEKSVPKGSHLANTIRSQYKHQRQDGTWINRRGFNKEQMRADTGTIENDLLFATRNDAIGVGMKGIGNAFDESSKPIENVVDGMITAKKAAENFDDGVKRLSESTKKSLKDIENLGKGTKTFSQNIVGVAQGVMSISFAISSLSSLWETWQDETIGAGEKMLQTFMSLGMAIPMLVNGIKGLGSALGITNAIQEIYYVNQLRTLDLTNAQVQANAAELLMKKLNIEQSKAEAIIKAILKIQSEKLTGAKIAETLAEAGLNTQKGIGLILTKLLTKYNLSLAGSYALVLGAIAGVIAGAVILVKILDALIVTQKEARENIEKSTEAYNTEKEKLDELNNSLDETINRIKELSEQDTLTLVEQEELEKLKLQNEYLERQIELQERNTELANQDKVDTTLSNFAKAYENVAKDYRVSSDYSNNAGANMGGGVGASTNYNYKDSEDQNYLSPERLEEYQKAEDAYFDIIQSIIFDGVEYNKEELEEAQRILSQNRKDLYSEAEYKTTFIDPLLETTKVDYSGDAIFDIMASGDPNAMQTAEALMSKQLENELKLAGVSVEEFLNYIASLTNETKKKISEDVGIPLEELDEYTKDFTQEDWQILASLNIENIDTADELWAAFDKYRETAINVEVAGIEELNQILEQLNNSQKPLETALSSYSDKGYLTMDEVQELINENPEYSKYVMYDAINDRYKLIGQTLTDFQNLEAKEKEALNELLDLNKEQNQLNTDYLNEYVGMLDALQESSDFSDLNNNYQELKTAAENYQQGNLSTSQYLEDVGKNIDTIIDQYKQLTEDIANGDETADELEAALTSVTGMLANGLMDLNKQFQAGTITMQDYYSGTVSGTKSLINSYQGLYKNIIRTADGTYKLKDSMEKVSDEEKQAVEQLNLWQKQIDNAEGMSSVVEALTENYDYLVQYAGAFGQIDFTINDNFDTTAQHFQTMCDSMGHTLVDLAKNNADAYSNIIKTVQAQGFKFDAGLTTSAKALSDQMNENADLASAVVNACMEETGGVITSVSQAAGSILAELDELITNFDYNISFTVDNAEKLDKYWFFKFLKDPTTELPSISITGNGGDSTQGFTQALSSTANFLSSQGTGMGQGGIFDYGDEGYDGSALNPNSIITDNLNSSQDDAFERLQDKLKLNLQIDEDELKRLEYFINKMSDDFYLLGQSAEKLWETFEHRENILETHKAHIADLTAAYNAGQISAEDYNSGLEESKDAIYEQLNALLDLDKQMKEYYGNTLDEADTELEDHTDHLNHLSKVFDHYVNLMDIFGKSKDYDAMGNFLQGQADVIKNELDVIEDYYDGLLKEKDEVEKLLADAVARGDEEAQELYEIMLDDITDKVDETQDKMLEMTEEWGEAMKKVFENTFNKLSDELEKALTDGMGFESMLDDFDLLNQQQEEFLTKTNQIYETNKLMRTAMKAADDTSNKAAKQKIKNFVEETKKLQETTRLSKYELEVQQAKYDLLLAEIALEEAQNAKSTVRLTRDNEGNFGYVYTADQDEVDNAQQQLEDAQNNLYNIQYEGQQNALTKYVEALQDYKDAVIEVEQNRLDGKYASEEEYRNELARLEDAYFGPMGILTELSRLYNITLQENTNATAENLLNQYGFMTDGVEQHANLVQQYISDMDAAWNDFQDALIQVHDEVQTTLGDSEQATKDLTDEGKTLADSIKKDVVPAIHDEIKEVREATSAYALQRDSIDSLIKKYEDYIDTLERVAIAEGKAAQGNNGDNKCPVCGQYPCVCKNEPYPTGVFEEHAGEKFEVWSDGTLHRVSVADNRTANAPSISQTNTDDIWNRGSNTPKDTISIGTTIQSRTNGKVAPYQETLTGGFSQRDRTADWFAPSSDDIKGGKVTKEKQFDGSTYYLVVYNNGKTSQWFREDQIAAMSSGGYTGDWGPEGKLAMLHEKELVLNASDTENILSAVSMIREIVSAIDSRAQMASLMTMSSVSNITSTGQTLEQSVMIEASFPNATDRYEIEEAFNSLVNKASQYANRK